MARNPLKDSLAVVGVGSTPYGRDLKRTELSLALEAAVGAIEDAGIDRQEIDGVCGTGMDPLAMGGSGFLTLQGALGIEKTTWQKNGWLGSCFVYAAEAVFSGLCDTVLVVQAYTRGPGMSRSAANDPFRLRAAQQRMAGQVLTGQSDFARRWIHSGEPYAAWMARYMHDYKATKDAFARIAVNNRTHATRNPRAAMRTPITMEDYHASRVIWEPMQMLDMDVPVDCAEALIITTAERAMDLRHKPVYIHAMSLGGSRVGEYYDNSLGWTDNSLWISLAGLWERSDVTIDDLDLFFPYDGYTIDTVGCIEAAGFCKPGEAGDLLASSWDAEANILRLGGHTLLTTNGGGLSQGRAGGFNFYTEAVRQLRGAEGERQVPDARTALVCPGSSFFHDPASVMLRTD
ncbi:MULTISPECIES: thiolase family protein [unclassified Parafrankia]|uniref:thiolase family protein n=1 Tax=unclassified Parafrankia TaxID=2994368 RepID=UPI000DA4691F|nr:MULTISPECIES: thiolase family protein [unclassified Parafrankia]TCJ33768.1 thiolase family protein [Parafrankia sp. BMG5.11]SQD93545.1 Acetyl-CoA acetyltransferase [Parafrankia sp. Ea1.12]